MEFGIEAGQMELRHRYLHGPAVDQILADERRYFDVAPPEHRVVWPLTDAQGTVRDLVNNNGGNHTHYVYDAFGNRSGSGSLDTMYGYTGREWDSATNLNYHRARWYDPAVGKWINEDPIDFGGGDYNLSRYVGNGATNWVDPTGYWQQKADGYPYVQDDNPKQATNENNNKGSFSLWKLLYTGDAWAPDSVYRDATNAGGAYYTEEAGNTHLALDAVAQHDPTGVAALTGDSLEALEGEELHGLVMENADEELIIASEVHEDINTLVGMRNALRRSRPGSRPGFADQAGSNSTAPPAAPKAKVPKAPKRTGGNGTGAPPKQKPGDAAESSGQSQIQKNKANGEAWEQEVVDNVLPQTQNNVQRQISIRSNGPSKKKVRVDAAGNDKETGDIRLTDAKASPTAPFTPNQVVVYPELKKFGGTVSGKGKPPFSGGTEVPPTDVDIVRKE